MSDWQPRAEGDRLDLSKTLGLIGASLAVIGICATVAWFVDWSRHATAVAPVATAQESLNQAAAERARARAARQRAAWLDHESGTVQVPVDLTMEWFAADAQASVSASEEDAEKGTEP